MPICSKCKKDLQRVEFTKSQLKKDADARKCKVCVGEMIGVENCCKTSENATNGTSIAKGSNGVSVECSSCKKMILKTDFSKSQLRKDANSRKCKVCVEETMAAEAEVGAKDEKVSSSTPEGSKSKFGEKSGAVIETNDEVQSTHIEELIEKKEEDDIIKEELSSAKVLEEENKKEGDIIKVQAGFEKTDVVIDDVEEKSAADNTSGEEDKTLTDEVKVEAKVEMVKEEDTNDVQVEKTEEKGTTDAQVVKKGESAHNAQEKSGDEKKEDESIMGGEATKAGTSGSEKNEEVVKKDVKEELPPYEMPEDENQKKEDKISSNRTVEKKGPANICVQEKSLSEKITKTPIVLKKSTQEKQEIHTKQEAYPELSVQSKSASKKKNLKSSHPVSPTLASVESAEVANATCCIIS